MRKLLLLLPAFLLLSSVLQAQEQRTPPTPEQIQAYLASLRPEPEKHHLFPDAEAAKESPYKGFANYGKRIAVFGGSLSVNKESDAAKQQWANQLGTEVVTYGVGGAGFSIEQGCSLQKQVDEAGVYDIYVLWASTNDYVNSRPCGNPLDYTALDNYDEGKLNTQCGGINYCIKPRFIFSPPSAFSVFLLVTTLSQRLLTLPDKPLSSMWMPKKRAVHIMEFLC